MTNTPSIPEINQMLVNAGVETVVAHLIGQGNYQRNGTTLGMASYQGGKDGQSFQITVSGTNAGRWFENNLSDSPNSTGNGDLVELWSLVNNISKGEALKEIKDYLGISSGRPRPKLSVVEAPKEKAQFSKQLSQVTKASPSSMNKLQGRLRQNQSARDYLYSRGLTDETIEYFKLGLSAPYERKNGLVSENALVFPTVSRGGFVKPFCYYAIPGITKNPVDKNGWASGAPRFCFNMAPKETHQFLIVVEGLKDLWILHQVIAGTDLEDTLLILSSSHGSALPLEAKDNPAFFRSFEKVYLGFDNDAAGREIEKLWLPNIGPRAHRVVPHDVKDWTDFFRSGLQTAKHLTEILKDAEPLDYRDNVASAINYEDTQVGNYYSLPELDARYAYYNGHMYYTVTVIEAGLDAEGGKGLNKTVKVIRSDRRLLHVVPVRRSTNYSVMKGNLHRLDDGTLLKNIPDVSGAATWRWEDVKRWLDGEMKPRTLGAIVDEIEDLIRTRVWLPNEDDYTVLALTMVTTFVQHVFDAVPYLLATGAAASGKSELATVLSLLGANAVSTGDISSKTITRLIDKTKGFLIYDDAEKVSGKGKGKNDDGDTSDLLQILKVAYKKSSGVRQVTNNKTMEVEELDFYGVKMFTNTKGIEDILETRTIQIHTRKPTNGYKQKEMPLDALRRVRAELHAWAMENASLVDDINKTIQVASRNDEITKPFRVFSELARRPDWNELTDRLLERMESDKQAKVSDSPEGYLRESIMNIARRGYTSVTMEHVLMEMDMLVPAHFGKSHMTDIPEWRHAGWAKKNLYDMGYLVSKSGKRVRVANRDVPLQNLYILSPDLFGEIQVSQPEAWKKITSNVRHEGQTFCRRFSACNQCPYENIDCDIRNKTGKRTFLVSHND